MPKEMDPPMSRAPFSNPLGGNGNGDGIPSHEDRFLRYKRELHQQLISSMDLGAIGTMSEEDLRLEVRRAAEELCRLSSEMLSLSERERLEKLRLFDTFVPKIPLRSPGAVAQELKAIRLARRSGGRRPASRDKA